jgi:hypothetical protein
VTAEKRASTTPPPTEESSGERSTLVPPYDVEAFARSSDSALRAVGATGAGTTPSPPAPRNSVTAPLRLLLLDPDRLGRAAIIRGLLREGMEILAAGTLDDVDVALASEAPFDAAVVHMGTPQVRTALATMLAVSPAMPIVALCSGQAGVTALLEDIGVARFALCERAASTRDLLDALAAVVRAEA